MIMSSLLGALSNFCYVKGGRLFGAYIISFFLEKQPNILYKTLIRGFIQNETTIETLTVTNKR